MPGAVTLIWTVSSNRWTLSTKTKYRRTAPATNSRQNTRKPISSHSVFTGESFTPLRSPNLRCNHFAYLAPFSCQSRALRSSGRNSTARAKIRQSYRRRQTSHGRRTVGDGNAPARRHGSDGRSTGHQHDTRRCQSIAVQTLRRTESFAWPVRGRIGRNERTPAIRVSQMDSYAGRLAGGQRYEWRQRHSAGASFVGSCTILDDTVNASRVESVRYWDSLSFPIVCHRLYYLLQPIDCRHDADAAAGGELHDTSGLAAQVHAQHSHLVRRCGATLRPIAHRR